jgi:RNA recognition motif-containing protein
MQTATATLTKKLLIGNLPDQTETSAVKDVFSVVGRVISVAVVSNGFAFVEMTAEDADTARQKLNGYRFNGNALIVDDAYPSRNLARSSRP